MSKKYLTPPLPGNLPSSYPTLITNDLFLAAFLSTVGCTLDRIEKNERRRVSFVFVGERVRELRDAYRTGKVSLDIRAFRDNLNRLRDLLTQTVAEHYPDERSMSHVHHARNLNTRYPSIAHA
jgi:hypothetical protein